MDALGKSLALMVALVAVICIVPIASDSADGAGEADGLLLYEVNPYDREGVSVYNYGTTAVDLRDYIISDYPEPGSSEGYIHFEESIIVQPDSFVVIATDSGDSNHFVDREGVTVHYIGSDGVTEEKDFALKNSGDDVYLIRDGKIIDAVCYGKIVIDDPSVWASDNSFSDEEDTFFQRHGTYDTDSEEDWFNYIFGQTQYWFDPDYKINATVTPFLFPDSGGIPVYDAVASATESLYINVYIISNKNICGLILDMMRENENLDVDILIEGTPVEGYVQNVESLVTLARNGADVRMIGTGDDARFVQDHAKYAIVDMEKVVVTSENWTPDNLNGHIDDNVYSGDDGNRGWGAVIESTEYAQFMYGVFQNDFSMEYGDVTPILDEYSNANGDEPYYVDVEDAEFKSFRAQVTPILSNDNSFDYTEYFIGIADERIYCEQQSLGSYYKVTDGDSPIAFLAKRAADGVDTRLILSTGVDDYNDVELWINQATSISAAVLNTPYVHNKGIVSDDVAIVSSVNWTSASFFDNRECAVAIYSEEVADYFAEAFIADFERCYDYDGISVDLSSNDSNYPAGQEIVFTVNVNPPGSYTYIWDFGDGSEPFETDLSRVPHVPDIGGDSGASFELSVTVMDGDVIVGKNSMTYSVGNVEVPTDPDDPSADDGTDAASFLSDYMYIIAPLIVIILAIIGAASRAGRKGKKRK